jgi:hypothetical protein
MTAIDRTLDELIQAENASHPSQLATDCRAVQILSPIAFSSYGGVEHALSIEAAKAVLARAARARLTSAAERASVAESAGEISERILGDLDAARRWYATALQNDPDRWNARSGSQRVAARDAAISQRMRDIEVARQREAAMPPPPQPRPTATPPPPSAPQPPATLPIPTAATSSK